MVPHMMGHLVLEPVSSFTDNIHSSNSKFGITLHSVSNIDIAESTKVVENCHRFL